MSEKGGFFSALKRLSGSLFVKNSIKLAGATTITQIIAIGTAPILYRIYDKENYGTLGLYMAIANVLGVFSTLQYTQTILIEKDNRNAVLAVWMNRYINAFFSFLVLVLLLILYRPLTAWANNPAINNWLWFLPVSIFFSGQNELYRVWAVRNKEFNILSLNSVLTGLLVPAVSITLGLWIRSEAGLFAGLLVSQFVPAVILFFSLQKKYSFKIGYSFQDLKMLAVKHRNFPRFGLGSEFVNRLTNQLPVFFLNTYAGSAMVGVYNLCTRMLVLPIQLVGSAISTVYQQRATEDFHKTGTCIRIFRKTALTLSMVSFLPLLVIFSFGPQLFSFVFGTPWREAGEFARIFVVMFTAQLIVSPLTYIFIIRNRLSIDFWYHMGILTTLALAYSIGIHYFGVRTSLWLHSLGYTVWYLIYFMASYKLSNNAAPEPR